MSSQLLLTVVILAVAITLFLSDRLRADLVALWVVVALGVSGVLTSDEAFSGFSRSAVITIMAIFILAEGLERTGVTQQVGNLLLRVAGVDELRLVIVVMLSGAGLSLFMNNIAAASVLLPAVSGAAHEAQVAPSRLLMPLAFATILGGMATLFTTTNIVAGSLLRDAGLAGFSVLDFLPLGLPIVLTGILYMALWGRHRLPVRSVAERLQAVRDTESDLTDLYRLEERLFRVRVPAGSYLIGRTLAQSTFREQYGLQALAFERDGQTVLNPPPHAVFRQGDIIVLEGKLDEFRRQDVIPHLEIMPPQPWHDQDLESASVVIVETALAPRSSLLGQTLRATDFRERYGMSVLAIWRGERPVRTGLADLPLQLGDALLLQGPRERLPILRRERDLILLSDSRKELVPVQNKGWAALAIMLITLALAASGLFPVGEVMLGGALVMALAGVLTMDQAYQAIEWKSVFLVAGMLPMGIAMVNTGAAGLLTDGLTGMLGTQQPLLMLGGLFILTTLLAQAMNGAAVAAIVVPVAIQTAHTMAIDPRALVMGVTLATSMAFLTPLGHPVNVLVMGPGGYRFRDYFRVGLPLSVLLFVVVMLLLPLTWPFYG